ncbi:MAG: NAD(P)(+) transhydrogenase (Re/Si-specific) subunit beta [Acidimicrobiales bacterium]
MTGYLAVSVSPHIFTGLYLLAAVVFILALKALSSPKYARYGMWTGIVGMVVAAAITWVAQRASHDWIIAVAFVAGAAVAVPAARLIKMTAIPQMVAIFNGVGGGAAATVTTVEFLHDLPAGIGPAEAVEVIFGVAIGCISFSGSMLAFLKLQELMTGTPVTYRGQQVVNGVAFVVTLWAAVMTVADPHDVWLLITALAALAVGAGIVLPVGGADTPVLISLLNAFTGLAVAADGFALHNLILLVAGTLVGASGGLLTKLMSDAMGRSLPNILFAGVGSKPAVGVASSASSDRAYRSGDAADVATLLAYSRRVMMVPGYGLAVAQAQQTIVELAKALKARGVSVAYVIKKETGRMPGHMNVLLAEANVPYEELEDMDQANAELPNTDVALVVGANDVVNPAAKNVPASPIYGMPILNVDEAAHVVFLKRSMRPGFSGVQNELFYDPKTIMLFGDAKDSLAKLVSAVKVS